MDRQDYLDNPLVTYVPNSKGIETSITIVVTLPTTRPDLVPVVRGQEFGFTYVCCKCRMPNKEKDTIVFRGKYYGIPCGCSSDIAQLASKGR